MNILWNFIHKIILTITTIFSKGNNNQNQTSQLGKLIYSSKPQAELEKEEKQSLFKIAEGVYANRVAYNQIKSEYHPSIEYETTEEYIPFTLPLSNVQGLAWHPFEPKLITIRVMPNTKLMCSVLNVRGKQLLITSETEILLSKPYGEIIAITHHPDLPQILIVSSTHVFIWNYDDNCIVQIIDVGKYKLRRGDFYPNKQLVWLLTKSYSDTENEWLIWNYETNIISQYDLELNQYGDYSRGSILHPSGELICALWSGSYCGCVLHTAHPKNESLFYFSEPIIERGEYEAYEHCFSSDGKYVAFFTNPFLGHHENHSKICVYEIETGEIALEFYTGTNLYEKQLQFMESDNAIAFYETTSNTLNIFNAKSGKS